MKEAKLPLAGINISSHRSIERPETTDPIRNRVSLINKLKGVPPSESKIGMKSNHNWKN